MPLKLSSVPDLAQALSSANGRKEKIGSVDLSSLDRILECKPEDMTVTVEAGITLGVLQAQLGKHGQWLSLDPPKVEQLTISELIHANLSGPRRYGYGTVRDFLIGITVAMADGRIIHSGGKVVKNVAGYDLAKLFIGSKGSLGVVIGATFKVRPLPELEVFVQKTCEHLEEAEKCIEAVVASPITPIVLDLYQSAANAKPVLVLGFAGTREEVEWQTGKAAELGVKVGSSLDHETLFHAQPGTVQRTSALPSKMVTAIRELKGAAYVARAGNGIIYHRGAAAMQRDELPLELLRRVKDAYDPNHIFPEMPT